MSMEFLKHYMTWFVVYMYNVYNIKTKEHSQKCLYQLPCWFDSYVCETLARVHHGLDCCESQISKRGSFHAEKIMLSYISYNKRIEMSFGSLRTAPIKSKKKLSSMMFVSVCELYFKLGKHKIVFCGWICHSLLVRVSMSYTQNRIERTCVQFG